MRGGKRRLTEDEGLGGGMWGLFWNGLMVELMECTLGAGGGGGGRMWVIIGVGWWGGSWVGRGDL